MRERGVQSTDQNRRRTRTQNSAACPLFTSTAVHKSNRVKEVDIRWIRSNVGLVVKSLSKDGHDKDVDDKGEHCRERVKGRG